MKTFLILVVLAVSALSSISAHLHHGGWRKGVRQESRSMDQLYKAALAELSNGEKLIVYVGGDDPHQADYLKQGFEERFPGLKAELIVDFSKFHDARIDYQLATNTIVPDVTHLQTTMDYPRWKNQGALLKYKPIDWDKVDNRFKDKDGAYTAVFLYYFSNVINRQLLPNKADWPTEARDFLKPEYKNKLVMTYPNDDDAVLYLFKEITDKYGLEYLSQLKAQNVTWVRGTQRPADLVTAGEFVTTFTTGDVLTPAENASAVFILPKSDPFILWPQRAAILKKAPHPETAKLYMSWLLSLEMQNTTSSFSVRKDVKSPPGYKSIWDYPNGNPLKFQKFMDDRAAVERYKYLVTVVLGEPQGPSPTGDLGIHPKAAIFSPDFNSSSSSSSGKSNSDDWVWGSHESEPNSDEYSYEWNYSK